MKLQDIEGIDELMLKYKFALSELTNKITILLEEYEFNNKTDPIEHTKTRFKTLESAESKLRKKGYEVENIYDTCYFKVLVDEIEDCYYTLYLIHSLYTPIPGRFKDYIGAPRTNFYQSLHTTIADSNGKLKKIKMLLRFIALLPRSTRQPSRPFQLH